MITKRVLRYYCEHCRKSSGSKFHMTSHERGCTLNPSRVCGLHAKMEEKQPPTADLVAMLNGVTSEVDAADALARVRKACDGCPACILAAIRQARCVERICVEGTQIITCNRHFDFDFKAELKSFWADYNDTRSAE